ncbi:hypothetical protein SLS59_006999 [Nothophoma quercina]|uniref:Uncharacterized protein n=1 Tax=Nothophoma quercina TaxID=749835 RepID=A0ABR3R1K3_9PLEO
MATSRVANRYIKRGDLVTLLETLFPGTNYSIQYQIYHENSLQYVSIYKAGLLIFVDPFQTETASISKK